MIREKIRREMREFFRSFRPGGRGLLAAILTIDVILVGAVLVLNSLQSEEKRLRISAQALVDRLAGELIVVQDRLAQAQRSYEETQSQLEKAESEKQILMSEIEQRDAAIHEMGVELAQLKMKSKHVDLGKIVVAGEARKKAIASASGTQSPPAAAAAGRIRPAAERQAEDGEVLSFNPEFNFVIVNRGSKDGIKEGMQLELIQDGQSAGNLRVDMVDESICAAAILAQKTPRDVQIGDRVRTPKS